MVNSQRGRPDFFGASESDIDGQTKFRQGSQDLERSEDPVTPSIVPCGDSKRPTKSVTRYGGREVVNA